MPTVLGYASSGAVGIIDVISSYADEKVKVKVKDAQGVVTEVALGDRTVNALNTERIVGTIGTGVAAWMLKNKADTPLKRGIEIAHYAYVPLFIRSMVNIIRREVLHIIKVPIYEWLCPCKSWHIDRCIQHGYWEQTDMIDFRQIGEFEIALAGPARKPRRVLA